MCECGFCNLFACWPFLRISVTQKKTRSLSTYTRLYLYTNKQMAFGESGHIILLCHRPKATETHWSAVYSAAGTSVGAALCFNLYSGGSVLPCMWVCVRICVCVQWYNNIFIFHSQTN